LTLAGSWKNSADHGGSGAMAVGGQDVAVRLLVKAFGEMRQKLVQR